MASRGDVLLRRVHGRALDVPEVPFQRIAAREPGVAEQPYGELDGPDAVPVGQHPCPEGLFGVYAESPASTRAAPPNTSCSAAESSTSISPAVLRKRSVRATGWPRLAGTRAWANVWKKDCAARATPK